VGSTRRSLLALLLGLALIAGGEAADVATQPGAEPARLFRFLAIGDPQFSTEERFRQWGDQLVAAETLKPDFAIALGDLTSAGKTDEFEWYRAAIARPAYKIYSLPGNHDYDATRGPENYLAALGPRMHSFDHRGYHFVCFDSQRPDRAWLEKDLADNAGKPIIFSQHYPPSHRLLPTLKEHGCILALSGHVHANRRGLRQGVPAFNLPRAPRGFMVVDAMRDGTIRATWRPQGAKGEVRAIYPGEGHAVPAGKVRLLVDAYGTNHEVERVEYDLGRGWQPMTRCGWRSWTAETIITAAGTIKVRAVCKTGQTWEASNEFALASPRPLVSRRDRRRQPQVRGLGGSRRIGATEKPESFSFLTRAAKGVYVVR